MLKNVLFDLANHINAACNKQVMKFFVKKDGHWMPAGKMDLLFFKADGHMPKRRGDLLQTNTWDNKILAVFIGNENDKDSNYTVRQLNEAEKMAPQWLRESSMQPGLV